MVELFTNFKWNSDTYMGQPLVTTWLESEYVNISCESGGSFTQKYMN